MKLNCLLIPGRNQLDDNDNYEWADKNVIMNTDMQVAK